MTTAYQAQYWAHALTLRTAAGSIENLSRSISNARVDLNPHQVDAALFALRSPLSKGVILADEVGLGKTIEAGIVIAQRWAERHRTVLLIVPATLRKQWQQELEEKFYLPTLVLDARQCALLERQGVTKPFQQEKVLICSYQFAAAKADDIARVPWDLVVIDEAHRLRNIYKTSSRTARVIASALGSAPKLLLTATPLQNSLMELYGLVSVIDDHVFGDAATFREQFTRLMDEQMRNFHLRERLKSICIRTLRKQVVEYIPFTRRVPFTQEFSPSDEEQALYDAISSFLRRDKLFSLPASQRMLITLVLRKLLASSSFAIAATLRRLTARLEDLSADLDLTDDDLEGIEEFEEEWSETELLPDPAESDAQVDRALLADELATLRRFADMAEAIKVNAKGEALLPALRMAFDRAASLGAPRKAVVFTESRRTQQYLFDLLMENGFDGELVLMNGTNTDPHSAAIYTQWLARHRGQEVISGSRPVDMKAAIVEQFRDHASILIATEAAAEGINLQFCSLVVNFDLPWNPQRVEQRIGRCHRYGQKHDVVVVNFLNRRNEADKRVFQLLSEKFNLFDGIFGASDEVLGAVESGVDIERRIAQVYQTCRTTAEISTAFDALQAELDEQIQSRLSDTRQSLLEHFDADVSERLRVHKDKTLESLSERERWLMGLTKAELDGQAEFEQDRPRFRYFGTNGHQGHYHFDWKEAEKLGDIFYRQNHPLAVHCIDTAIGRVLPMAQLTFDYTGYGAVVSVLKPLVGASGWLELTKLVVTSLDAEEFLIFTAQTETGERLDQEMCRKLFQLPATLTAAAAEMTSASLPPSLDAWREEEVQACLREVETRNGRFFDEEVLKLDRWSDDLKQGLEREIKEIDRAIRDARRVALMAGSLQEKLDAQKHLRALESERNRKRRELFEAQDQIDAQRDALIAKLEGQLRQKLETQTLFAVGWAVR
jgi:adenine-specific DNA-methyltransferase